MTTLIKDTKAPEQIVTIDVIKHAKENTSVSVFNYQKLTADFFDNKYQVDKENLFVNLDTILENSESLIGHTPMIRLNKIAKKYNIKCDLVAKCDYLSVGGSVKDRMAYQILKEAEDSGKIHPGKTVLIAPTSGNTGVALCMLAAIKGYKVVITLPEKMSEEKFNTMVALGAEVIRTPTECGWNNINSNIGLATQLNKVMPNSFLFDQYREPGNPRAHYLSTAEEILSQCSNQIDTIVLTAGTGGTLTGVAAKIKENLPNCKIVGVDPKGSILAQPNELNEENLNELYLVEGIGYDFIPSTLNRAFVDEWIKVDDYESLNAAREIILLEGLLVGGSSGSALAGALKVAQKMSAGERCVVLFPDSCRNYMSKFMSNEWMIYHNLKPIPNVSNPFNLKTVFDLKDLKIPVTISIDEWCQNAITIMKCERVEHVVVINPNKTTVGVISLKDITKALVNGYGLISDPVTKYMNKNFKFGDMNTSLTKIVHSLNTVPYYLIIEKDTLKYILTLLDVAGVSYT